MDKVVSREGELRELNLDLEKRVADRTAALDAALSREREVGEMKMRFTSLVSREFRTPLGVIGSSAQLTIDPEAESAARADDNLLRHILTNLLTNAHKYSPPGAPVHLTLARDGSDAVFTVRDEGIGIPEEDQARIFEALHRASNVGQISGTGLGLVLVRRCCELHGGSVAVHSHVGVGTTFTVRVPVFA